MVLNEATLANEMKEQIKQLFSAGNVGNEEMLNRFCEAISNSICAHFKANATVYTRIGDSVYTGMIR